MLACATSRPMTGCDQLELETSRPRDARGALRGGGSLDSRARRPTGGHDGDVTARVRIGGDERETGVSAFASGSDPRRGRDTAETGRSRVRPLPVDAPPDAAPVTRHRCAAPVDAARLRVVRAYSRQIAARVERGDAAALARRACSSSVPPGRRSPPTYRERCRAARVVDDGDVSLSNLHRRTCITPTSRPKAQSATAARSSTGDRHRPYHAPFTRRLSSQDLVVA